MKGSTLVFLLEFGLVFGSALAFGFWQLYSLKKADRESTEKEERDAGTETTDAP